MTQAYNRSHPLDETIDHFFLAGFFEGDGELVAVDLHHLAIAEFLVKHAVAQGEFRNGAGGFRDQLAFDGHRRALGAGAGRVPSRGSNSWSRTILRCRSAKGRSRCCRPSPSRPWIL